MKRTTWVVVNPAAGGGKGHSLRQLPGNFEVRHSQSSQDLQQTARDAVQAGAAVLVACGGDGTVHGVVQELAGSDTALAIIPMGRGNDIARNLGIPKNPAAAAALLRHGLCRTLDLGRIGSVYFLGVAGVGLDSAVNRFANERCANWPGALAYPYSLLRILPRFRPPQVEVVHGQGGYHGEMMFVAVANMAAYGGGMKIAPRADPADGLLDVCLVRRSPRLRLLRAFPGVYFGKHLETGWTEYWQVPKVEIATAEPLPIFADGEFITNTPAVFEVVPRSIQVIVPA